jgi:prophage antirepressor-like protein
MNTTTPAALADPAPDSKQPSQTGLHRPLFAPRPAAGEPSPDKGGSSTEDGARQKRKPCRPGKASEPMLFNFDGLPVRSVKIKGEPWFVAADVAAVLEYRDAFNLARILDDDERGTHVVSTPGGDQEMSTINESGLYAAILKSRKPEAQRFRRWVTGEVLPSIRKTGGYRLDDHARRVRDVLGIVERSIKLQGLRGPARLEGIRAAVSEIAPDLLHLVATPATAAPVTPPPAPVGDLPTLFGKPQEGADLLLNIADWFRKHAKSGFLLWAIDEYNPKEAARVAGWVRPSASGNETFFILVDVFRSEVCKGFDHREALRLLDERGLVIKEGKEPKPGEPDKRRMDTKAKPPRFEAGSAQVYRIKSDVLNLTA